MFRNNSMFGRYNQPYQNQLPLVRTDSNQMGTNDQKIQPNQTIQEPKLENKIEPKFETPKQVEIKQIIPPPTQETPQHENKFLDKNEFYDL